MRFEGIEKVWIKLIDTDVQILPSEDGTVHVYVEPEDAFTLKRDGSTLKVLTSTGWKLKNLLKKEKERARLSMRIPDDFCIEGSMKRGSLKAKRTRFDSIAIGEATAELEECEVKSPSVGPSKVKGSMYIREEAEVTVSMGNLELKILELGGDLEVLAVMGSITLKLPEDCDAVIETVQQGGGVVVNSGRLLGSGDHRVKISSVKGVVIVDTWGELDEV
ncbi:DUF4097 family beta strand repeat-containing protein [Pyrococcus yayanosii]|uniref:Adhesin domain-containing protein n=1 Tax=Pyrococcus yayanosii (strain CH1 / JCM 16557) TaxID=529709 RepID=F8AIN2_PYRYC|nr:hypothetical protein [Pyrococcus yayanosii]AEH24404.1 hypothetical protein PYCH_07160 [Pyrococcus yayanosii CH1]